MPPRTDREWAELSHRAALALRGVPNVHSVGVGGRRRDGKPTGEPVLVVFVGTKVSLSELPPGVMVPSELEGVPTDIVQAGAPRPAVATQGATWGGPYDTDDGRHRPLRGGSRMTGAAMSEFFGTVGFLARLDLPQQRVVVITAHHTLFSAAGTDIAGLRVGQPTLATSSWNCCNNQFGNYIAGVRDASMDVAAIVLDKGQEYYAQIDEIGVVAGQHDVTQAEAASGTYPVRKRGSGTGITGGTVHAINVNTTDMSIQNFMSIVPNPAASGTPGFADHGDSGAAVVNDSGEIVGLLWGIGDTSGQPDVGWAYGWQIADVRSRLELAGYPIILETATAPDEKRIAPGDTASNVASTDVPPILQQLEDDLRRTADGQLLTALWLKHIEEVHRIIAHNKRNTVLWRRSGGAALLQCALRMAYDSSVVFPQEIEGRAIDACVAEMLELIVRCGSDQLRCDLEVFRGLVPPLGGRSYAQLVLAIASHDGRGQRSWPA